MATADSTVDMPDDEKEALTPKPPKQLRPKSLTPKLSVQQPIKMPKLGAEVGKERKPETRKRGNIKRG